MQEKPSRRRPVAVADPEATRRLFDALEGRARGSTALVRVTKADAVALSGLPSDQAEPALKALARTYRSHLAVTDEGELVWAFDRSFERRDRVPLAEKLRKAMGAAWRGFQLLFKIWIVATLVIYVAAFVAIMIALLFARSSDDRDDRRGGGDGGLFWLWFWLMPDWAPARPYDPYGRPRRALPKRPSKRFYQAVFDFVFGPKQAPADPRALDKRILAFLRDKKGRMTAAELSALSGLSLADAEEEMTRLMAEYDGEVEVADDGTLIFVFTDVLPSAGEVGTDWRWTWDELDKPVPLTGNTPGANAAAGGFAAFNLLASLTIGPAFLAKVGLAGDPTWSFFVTAFPLAFSTLFLGIPAARALRARRAEKKRLRRRVRRELMREIWTRPGEPKVPEAIAARVAERAGVPEEQAKRALDRLLAELEGDVVTDDDGKVRYTFPRLAEEQAAVERARRLAKEVKLGPVVFSSDGEVDDASPTASSPTVASEEPR
jgi:hypothetical protein